MTQITKIISGGQNGADLGGLHAAKVLGIETGGMAPKGYRVCNWDGSDGANPRLQALGLIESSSRSYPPRTSYNVNAAHGTLLMGYTSSPGARLAYTTCKAAGKPMLANPSVWMLHEWVRENNISVLNVAGNRASDLNPYIYVNTFSLVYKLLMLDRTGNPPFDHDALTGLDQPGYLSGELLKSGGLPC